jgi:PAS domain S-box-containing protein
MERPPRDTQGCCAENPLVCSILESISDGVFTVDGAWRITSFNRAAEAITGVARENAVGRPCWEVFRADACETACPLHRTLESGTPIINRTAYIVTAEGERIPVSLSTAILKNEDGEVLGGAETFRDLSVEEELKQQLHGGARGIVSHSPAMRRVLGMLPDVAASDATVVIQGETGTGKELLARAIHDLSPRRNAPFVAVNCGALPDTLLESELFGYRKGAFTDAKADKPGRFALAEGGTIFLDEIGDLSPVLQVKLLRVLQEKTYDPLGATEPVPADVRVITATHRDLDAMVEREAFRRDLYYRINVVALELPPLRERPEDIPLLADHFVQHNNRLRGVEVEGLSADAIKALQRYSFPGNVRELENLVERAFVVCHHGEIGFEHLPAHVVEGTHLPAPAPSSSRLEQSSRDAEAEAIREALEHHHYNRAAAAEALGIHKSTLHRKIRRLGLDLPDRDGRSARRD